MSVSLSVMRDAASWENHAKLKHFLGQQLHRGRLALVLGAGASFGFGLPGWQALVDDMFKEAGQPPPVGQTPPEASDRLYVDVLGKDEKRLVELLEKALYRTFDSSVNTLRRNELLIGLAALVVQSGRGHASRIVTFNFDNVLEQFLKYFGLTVDSISNMPSWASAADVTVYHPHGFTPQDGDGLSDRVVFTQLQYDRLVGDNKMWEALLHEIFCSHTCVFIGLSGDDQHLRSLLANAHPKHMSRSTQDAFWGIRFGDSKDAKGPIWSDRGVFPVVVNDYAEVPSWLFEICQAAAREVS